VAASKGKPPEAIELVYKTDTKNLRGGFKPPPATPTKGSAPKPPVKK